MAPLTGFLELMDSVGRSGLKYASLDPTVPIGWDLFKITSIGKCLLGDVHLYLTVPFILSWSLLEAMAAGCAIVASDTPPVQEVLKHQHSALLVDFDVDGQVKALADLLDQIPLKTRLAQHAQKEAKNYSHRSVLELVRCASEGFSPALVLKPAHTPQEGLSLYN